MKTKIIKGIRKGLITLVGLPLMFSGVTRAYGAFAQSAREGPVQQPRTAQEEALATKRYEERYGPKMNFQGGHAVPGADPYIFCALGIWSLIRHADRRANKRNYS